MLTLKNISFERDYFHTLFSEVHLQLQPGECLQIKGANGSGKSTLLRIVAGFIIPTQGEILWKNSPITTQQEYYQQQLQYLGHQNALKPHLSVYENLQFFCALQAIRINDATIKKIIARIGLTAETLKQTQYLSAGQKRRLALAKFLLHPAPLWMMDEPTTSLDASGQILLAEMIETHLASGGMAIIATHHTIPAHDPIEITLGERPS